MAGTIPAEALAAVARSRVVRSNVDMLLMDKVTAFSIGLHFAFPDTQVVLGPRVRVGRRLTHPSPPLSLPANKPLPVRWSALS